MIANIRPDCQMMEPAELAEEILAARRHLENLKHRAMAKGDPRAFSDFHRIDSLLAVMSLRCAGGILSVNSGKLVT